MLEWLEGLEGNVQGARLSLIHDGHLLLLQKNGSIERLSLQSLKKAHLQVPPSGLGLHGDHGRHLEPLNLPSRDKETPYSQSLLNNNGKLLALCSSTQVLVAVIPLSGLGNASGPLKTTVIGSRIYVGGLIILKAAWSPLSASGSHLLILSSDGILRLFDLSVDSEEPEQSFDFTKPGSQFPLSSKPSVSLKNRRGMFSAETRERRVVSFAFGSAKSDGWGGLTVYGIMENGDIYSFCPVMPSAASLSLGQVHSLRAKLGKVDDNVSTTEKKNRYWTVRWIQDLEEQILAQEGFLPSEPVQVSFPKFHSKLGIFRQGPFLRPALPEDRADEDYHSVTDFHVLFDANAHYVWTAFSSLSVELSVNLKPPTPIWGNLNFTGLEDAPAWTLNSLYTLETFELFESVTTSSVSLLKDPKYSDVIYAFHKQGIHRLSFLAWKLILDEAIACKKIPELENLDFQAAFCDCDWLVATKSPVTGFAIVTDIYIGYCYIMSSEEGPLYGSPLSIRTPFKPPEASKIKIPESSGSSYPSVLKGTTFSIPPILTSGPLSLPKTPIIRETYPLFISQDSLPQFSKSVAQLRKQLEAIIDASGKVQSRLTEQIHELKSQLAVLSSSQSIISKFSSDALNIRITKIHERQLKIDQKADIILQILMDQTQPALSKAEQEWAIELQELHGAMKRKSEQTLAQLRAQKQAIAKEFLGQSALVSPKKKVLGSSQVERIRRSLDIEFDLISNATKRTERLVQAMQRNSLS